MSELEKILNDDLLKCEIVETAENDVERVDLIKWTHDNTFSVAKVCKENRLYNTVSIILKIQVVTWICQDLDTVFIKTL